MDGPKGLIMSFQLLIPTLAASKEAPATQSLMASEDRIDALREHQDTVVCCRCGDPIASSLQELSEACEAGEVVVGRLKSVIIDGKKRTGYSLLHNKENTPCSADYDKEFFDAAIAHNQPLLVGGELDGIPEGYQVRRSKEGTLEVAALHSRKTAPKAKASAQSKAKPVAKAKTVDAKAEAKASMQAAKRADELSKLRAENKALKEQMQKFEGFMSLLKESF
tara:strand:- start:573 stop:1238 length:666 start_codon:yes stop_codon:yes gene_type:complete